MTEKRKPLPLPPISAAALERSDETLRRMLATPPDPRVKKEKPKPFGWPRKTAK